MTVDALVALVNPTSCLPRIKAEPDAAHVFRALSHLSRLYSPKSLNRDEQALRDLLEPDRNASPALQDACDVAKVDDSEKRYAMDWLTRLIASGLYWIDDEEDATTAEDLLDLAGRILGGQASLEEAGAISRDFCFPLKEPVLIPGEHSASFDLDRLSGPIEIVLRDDPLPPSNAQSEATSQNGNGSSQDAAAAVGVQTWGAAIVVSDVVLRHPALFHPGLALRSHKRLRIAELGAGTGLLGMVAAKLLQQSDVQADVVLTDYHQQVLQNLRHNVRENFPALTPSKDRLEPVAVSVEHLDWWELHQKTLQGTLDESQPKFDLLLLADVIYAPEHALWIRSSIQALLRKPLDGQDEDLAPRAHIVMAVRGTGKFEGLFKTVEEAFRPHQQSSALPSLSTSRTDTPLDTVPGTPSLTIESLSGMDSKSHAKHRDDLHSRMNAISQREARPAVELGILKRRRLDKRASVGRDDEQEYLWFEIGWLPTLSTCDP
ncbi:hypothetical protein PHSY_000244 [Pseudozyma hubeiensis SY62]|uniref:Uncharacterized protein n=1 Tax=Pseudozyma hubeiensis (strain SY62) TaxID=1305764 RepID=R9NW19_PSEHS|nr:hypothetical protein PHSY_000244 [Pseudozyma hubeiensis SY62]GAC92689.1 hypothetical protein PHSY_000244 [Pseudozyma hubeiensis SY62]